MKHIVFLFIFLFTATSLFAQTINKRRLKISANHRYFTDQNGNQFIVAIYDSDALEQDPQVIEIYSC